MKLPVREPHRTPSEFHNGRGREPKQLKVGEDCRVMLISMCRRRTRAVAQAIENPTWSPLILRRSEEDGAQLPATVPTEPLQAAQYDKGLPKHVLIVDEGSHFEQVSPLLCHVTFRDGCVAVDRGGKIAAARGNIAELSFIVFLHEFRNFRFEFRQT